MTAQTEPGFARHKKGVLEHSSQHIGEGDAFHLPKEVRALALPSVDLVHRSHSLLLFELCQFIVFVLCTADCSPLLPSLSLLAFF